MSGPAAGGGTFNAVTLIRWFFALSLVCFHACIVAGHPFFFPVKGHAIVSVFFVLSGMLTYEGYMRRPGVRAFYMRRLRRLYPAYAAVVVVCAVALSLLSAHTLREYFTAAGFWKYLAANLSFLNFLSPELPGVFAAQKIHAVNSSLWTMKVEVMFYAVLPAIVWLARRFRPAAVIAALYVLSVAYSLYFLSRYAGTGMERYAVLQRQLPGEMMYFAGGMAAVHLRAWILKRRRAVLAVCMAAWVACSLRTELRPAEPLMIAGALTAVAYGSRRLSALSVRVPNLTYGLFLVHFPLLQALTALGLHNALGFPAFFAVSLAATVAAAAALHRVF